MLRYQTWLMSLLSYLSCNGPGKCEFRKIKGKVDTQSLGGMERRGCSYWYTEDRTQYSNFVCKIILLEAFTEQLCHSVFRLALLSFRNTTVP
jgi:hypothetical protein